MNDPERFADDAHRYALESRIATGGMGEVWRARDTVLGRPVAVKLLKVEYADDALFRRRFETEAKHAASLHHPGIAGVFDFGEAAPHDGSTTPRPYLVMELVAGQPLSDLLRPGAPLDSDVTRDLMAQTAVALGAAHLAGIVHRDVKPGNLIVTPDRRIKVTDFGIARATEGLALTETGQVMGTPAYLSPEQAEGRTATARSDVYSLGVVAFECLAGRRPFVADTPVATALAHLRQPVPELPEHVPAPLAAVVQRAMAKDPGARYGDASAFAAALRDPESAAGATKARTQVLAAAAVTPPATQVLPAAAAAAPPPVTRDPAPLLASGGSRRTNWLPWALLAAVVVIGALIIWQLGAGDGADDQQDPVTTPTQSNQPSTEPSAEPEPSATDTDTPTPTPTDTPTEPEVETVTVDPAAYVGRDHKDVAKELKDLDLEVEEVELANPGDQGEGIVAAVDPNGEVAAGETVVVSYYGKTEKTDDEGPGNGEGNGQGGGNE